MMQTYKLYLFIVQINLKALFDMLVASTPSLKSPEIILILLTCPLLQEDSHVMNDVLGLAIVITDMNERNRTTLSK